MVHSVALGKLIHEKNQKSKISWHCPFKSPFSHHLNLREVLVIKPFSRQLTNLINVKYPELRLQQEVIARKDWPIENGQADIYMQ